MPDLIIDTPQGIEAYMLLSVYHTLKMEVDRPNGPKWRANPAQQARTIMNNNGWPCFDRTRKRTLASYVLFLKDMKGIDVNA